MNKQLLSTIIVWIFVLPSLWHLNSSKITKNTTLYSITGEVTRVECMKEHNKYTDKIYLFYANSDKYLIYRNDVLKEDRYTYCEKIINHIKQDDRFTAIVIETFNQVLELTINAQEVLNFEQEVEKFNNRNSVFFNIFLIIGIVMTLFNFLIWYFKGNPDNWVKSSIFQSILYFIAIMAIIRFFFR